jgi:choline dehydrogenase
VAEEFDYVVVGAGSAGCVIAGRLTEDPAVTVCVLEAGGPDTSTLIQMPVGYVAMVPSRINNWAFETVPQPGLLGRKGYQPRGKALGGSSSINAMLYVRGHASDYDRWASLGNAGWSFAEVLPYFLRAENNENFLNPLHGQGGPLNVTLPQSPSPVNELFFKAAASLGLPRIDDYNGQDQIGSCLFQVTMRHGERCSAAKAYLTPALQRPNLRVLTRAATQRVIFDGTRATGIRYRQGGQDFELRARREVILSAGAFGSPQILMLSGVGDGAHLQQMGLRVTHHLPGVGENLQDHLDYPYAYRGPGNSETFGISLRGAWRFAGDLWQWHRQRRGRLTSCICEAGAFLSSTGSPSIPDLQLVFIVAIEDDHARKMHLGHGISGRVALLRPQSRGTVRLQSTDPDAALLIDPRFLSEPGDFQLLKYGARRMRAIMDAPPLAPVRSKPLYPVDPADDAAFEDSIRRLSDSQYHPVGTCKMGSDPLAVVDARLRVHGLSGLRVVDASIMPTIVGGNTNAATIMIGEKAADLLRQDARQ